MAQGVKLSEAARQDIARLVKEGKLSGNEIARQLGVSRDATQRYIKQLKNGLPPSDGQSSPPGSDPAPNPTAPTPELSQVTLRIDPEFHRWMCQLTAEEWAQLEANLRAEGCRDPLVVWPQDDGPPILLDGHHRYEICQQYGLPFRIVEAQGISTREDAQIWIVRNQLGRRNLTDFQRIELAEWLRPLLEARAKANQQLAGGAVPQKVAEPVETRQAIAEIAGVSRETVRKAEVILGEADEPTKEALRRGKRKIHGVYQDLRGPRRSSNGKAVSAASATMPGRPTAREPGLRLPLAERLIELAGAILGALDNWRQQYPQDSVVGAFALMEKHLRELQEYFRKKQQEMAERSPAVEVTATATTGE
jgi:ParB-like chromosome segregation protein Spo0J